MKTSKEKVLDWIGENFHDVSLEDCPIASAVATLRDALKETGEVI